MTNYGNFKPVGKDGIGTEPNTSDPFLPGLWVEHEKRIADFLEGYKRGIKGWGVIENSSGTSLKVLNHSNTSDCSVDVQPGSCIIDGTVYTESSIVNVSLAQANGSLNRWDLIVYNASASAPVARIGTASAIPTIPDMEDDDIPLGLVKRLAGDDTIEAGDIEDIRVVIESKGYTISASDTLISYINTEGKWGNSTYYNTPREVRTIFIPSDVKVGSNIRVSFDLKFEFNVSGSWAYGRVYINGSAVGTNRSTNLENYSTFVEDFSNIRGNDRISLYIQTEEYSYAYARNFQIKGDLVDQVDTWIMQA